MGNPFIAAMLKRFQSKIFSLWGKQKIGGLEANTTNNSLLKNLSPQGFPSIFPPPGQRPTPTEPSPAEGNPTKPDQETSLSSFFSRFAFKRYTYDPTNPHAVEFERLCKARQWGSSSVTKHFTEYITALKETYPDVVADAETPEAKSFHKREVERVAHDPSAGPLSEFHRSQAARKWGDRELMNIKKEVLVALETKATAPTLTGSAKITESSAEDTPALKATDPDEGTRMPRADIAKITKCPTEHAPALKATGPDEGTRTPVADFFRKYEFQDFTHDPVAEPLSEFHRLRAARKWEEERLVNIKKEFLAVLETKAVAPPPTGATEITKSPAEQTRAIIVTGPDEGTSTPPTGATDTTKSPTEQIHAINPTSMDEGASMPQTDRAKITKSSTEHTPALKATSPDKDVSTPVANFFRKYEFEGFTHDPTSEPLAEFNRLQAARKWGDRKLMNIKMEFLVALETKATAATVAGDAMITESSADHISALEATSPDKGTGTLVANFFRKYEFQDFTHDPMTEPLSEFHRLQAARKWRERKLKNIKKEFLAAMGTQATAPALTGNAMITESSAEHTPVLKATGPDEGTRTLVADFFRKYEFQDFTHDPVADPLVEFHRLQAARKWGRRKLKNIKKEFLAAIETQVTAPTLTGNSIITESSAEHTPALKATGPDEGTRTPVADFFRKYQFEGFTHDPKAEPLSEFRRLQAARKWGEKRLANIKKEFSAALETNAAAPPLTGSAKITMSPAPHALVLRTASPDKATGTPVANFFRKYEFEGFTHDPKARPLAEFRRLQAARKWGDRRLANIEKEFLVALRANAAAPLPYTLVVIGMLEGARHIVVRIE